MLETVLAFTSMIYDDCSPKVPQDFDIPAKVSASFWLHDLAQGHFLLCLYLQVAEVAMVELQMKEDQHDYSCIGKPWNRSVTMTASKTFYQDIVLQDSSCVVA